MVRQRSEHPVAAFLVRWRVVLFIVMAALTVITGLLIPQTNINSDETTNLPNNSQMRKGLTILEEGFPLMDIRMQTLRVLFLHEPPADTLRKAIDAIPDVERWLGTEEKDGKTLYQFMLPRDADGEAISKAVRARFGDRVIVEVEDNISMPDHIVLMLLVSVAVVLGILFLMCPSFVETLLLLFAIGVAVTINMGTNALLPSVYLVTHTVSSVLQLVLSMDFAIILMNRYRQERRPGRSKQDAMTAAVAGATPSILSSGFTTVASLLMLMLIRLKIGADLGIVLSKGVLLSILSTFTVLPALILWFDKIIARTERPKLRIPTDGLARFEMNFRVPQTILFVAIFVGSWFLQKRTTISYSTNFSTAITEEFPSKNSMLVLYRTQDEEAFMALSDSISKNPRVITCLDYPSIAMKPRTAAEWQDMYAELPEIRDSIPDGAVEIICYIITHQNEPQKMRIDELEPTARELVSLAGQFLPEDKMKELSSRFDVDKFIRKLTKSTLPKVTIKTEEPAADAGPEPAQPGEVTAPVDSASTPAGPSSSADSTSVAPPPVVVTPPVKAAYYNYESITQQRSSDGMADFLGFDRSNASLVYTIAKVRKGTMSADEFVNVLMNKILGNKMYAAMISKDQKNAIRKLRKDFDAILAAGRPQESQPVQQEETVPAGQTGIVIARADSMPSSIPPVVMARDTVTAAPVATEEKPASASQPAKKKHVHVHKKPVERLAEMAFSGKRYSSAELSSALNKAGVPITKEEADVLCLYHGYKVSNDTTSRVSLMDMKDFLAGAIDNPLLDQYFDEKTKERLDSLQTVFGEELGSLRTDEWSAAAIVTDFPTESEETFAFIDSLQAQCREQLSGETYFVGYSVMYKEMKEGFPRELLLLTLLTVAVIFLIVAITFRTPLVPVLLIPTVLSAVWLNVFASGLGGHTMLYISYLIVQSILMGATIDYSILFTQYYRDARSRHGKAESLKEAYQKSFHVILTSGLIIVVTPLLMTFTITDPMVISILRCISLGALVAILIILFILPGTLTIMDRWVIHQRKRRSERIKKDTQAE